MQIMKQSLLPLKCVRRNITQIKYLAETSPLGGGVLLDLSVTMMQVTVSVAVMQ